MSDYCESRPYCDERSNDLFLAREYLQMIWIAAKEHHVTETENTFQLLERLAREALDKTR